MAPAIPVVYVVAGLGALLGAVALAFKTVHVARVQDLGLDLGSAYSPAGVVLGGVGGFAFLGAGVLAHARRPENRVGLLMVLAGVGFFAEDLQLSGSRWVHSLGLLFVRASGGFLVHLVLAFPDGRLASWPERLLAGAAYAAVFVLTPVAALFTDTRRRALPKPNVLLVAGDTPVADVAGKAVEVIGAVVAAGVVAVLVRRWARAGPPLRRVLAPVFLAALLGGAGTVAAGLTDAHRPVAEALSWAPRVAFCLLPLGFLAGVWRVRLGRTAVATLLAQLRQPLSAAQLQAALGQAVGDPSLRVGYWLPDVEAFVDGRGRPFRVPGEDPGRGVTLVEPGGRRVAVLVHDPALREDPHVLEAVVATAELALDNQRLAAEMRNLAGRLVTAGDAERRRLERDLHDGAQQRLVTVALSLRLAVQRVAGTADAATAALLANSAAGLDAAIGELRELARGIHPAILTDAGLVPALQALVERTPEPDVRLVAAGVPRLSPSEETAGYYVAAEALTNALKHAHAGHIRITVGYEEGRLRIDVTDDGAGGAAVRAGSGLRGLRDRVTVLGGTLTIRSAPGRGTSVSAAIPCRAGGGPASEDQP
jgi:signal transduction histidine kinase